MYDEYTENELIKVLTQIFAETRQNVWRADPSYEFFLDGKGYQKPNKSEPKQKKLKANSENVNPMSFSSPFSPYTQQPNKQINQQEMNQQRSFLFTNNVQDSYDSQLQPSVHYFNQQQQSQSLSYSNSNSNHVINTNRNNFSYSMQNPLSEVTNSTRSSNNLTNAIISSNEVLNAFDDDTCDYAPDC